MAEAKDGILVNMLNPDGSLRCKNVTVRATRYRFGGGIALEATCEDGEPWGTLTVNLVNADVENDCVLVKDYSEGAGNVRTLATAQIIETPPLRWEPSGFVKIPVCRLTEKGMALVKAYDFRQAQETTFRVDDRVCWTDPESGETTSGWTVTSAPEPGDDGEIPEDGLYTIVNDSGSEAQVYAYELTKKGAVNG